MPRRILDLARDAKARLRFGRRKTRSETRGMNKMIFSQIVSFLFQGITLDRQTW